MKPANKTIMILIGAIINVSLLAFGQALNNSMIIAGAILIFLVLSLYHYREYFFPLILFYLPWSTILRFGPDSSSFHTLVIPVVFMILLVTYIKKQDDFRKNYFAFAIVVTSYTLIIKFLNGLSLDSPYLFFIIMLFFIPLYLSEYINTIRFDTCIVFLSMGNLAAGIASNLLITNQNILRYLDINKELQVGLRYGGFYGDPNYFSAQLLVAIAGLLIILTKVKTMRSIPPIIILIMSLCYFAMQSVSKMFILSLVIVFVLWMVNMLISRIGMGYKLGILITFAAIVMIIILENVFMKEIEFYLLRFGKVTNSGSLTTGRVFLWKIYIEYMLENPDKLFFGIGVSEDQVRILFRSNNAHNTVIQTIYQLGLVGTAMFLMWWKSVYDALKIKSLYYISGFTNMCIMSLAVFLPWLALDMINFREFFYFVVLLFLLKKYLTADQMMQDAEAGIGEV